MEQASRQAQRQAEKPQRVAHAALAGLKGLHACVARINAQRKAERSCKLQPLLAHLAAHGVGYRQAQAAAGYRKLCHVPGGQRYCTVCPQKQRAGSSAS